MILEGLVTTTNQDGSLQVAPMGPEVSGPNFTHFVLRPFPSSQSYKNLRAKPEGVLHVIDDVLLLAKSAIGRPKPPPPTKPAEKVDGQILTDCCRYFEFRVTAMDDSQVRVKLECEVVASGTLRDHFGFNRAKHAVLESAIAATRIGIIRTEEIKELFQRMRVIVNKTGGAQELEAMTILETYLRQNAPPEEVK